MHRFASLFLLSSVLIQPGWAQVQPTLALNEPRVIFEGETSKLLRSNREKKLAFAVTLGGGLAALATENPQRIPYERLISQAEAKRPFTAVVLQERIWAQKRLEKLPTLLGHRMSGALKGALLMGIPTLAATYATGKPEVDHWGINWVTTNAIGYAVGAGAATGLGLHLINKLILRHPSSLLSAWTAGGAFVGTLAWHIAMGVPYRVKDRIDRLIP